MKTYTKEELTKILELHAKYWRGEEGGIRADLRSANLYGTNLYGANLYGANLYGTNLYGANLYGTNLYGANLYGANLYGANLYGANLYGADLRSADLRSANLGGADLNDEKLADIISQRTIVPEIGPFYAFKKLSKGEIATLYVPRSAKRLGGLLGRKCRVSKAKVVKITLSDGTKATKEYIGISRHDPDFKYTIGTWVKPKENFSNDVKNECASGIHIFITSKEAKEYN